MGECLLCRVGEFSRKLCCYVAPDSVIRLEADKAEMFELFGSLSQDIDTALEKLTGRLAASSKYQNCLDDVQMWFSKAETDMSEIVSRIQLHQDPAIHLEQLRALQMEVGGNREKLDRFGKCCRTVEEKQLYDGFCERYKDLTNDLKVFDVCFIGSQYCKNASTLCTILRTAFRLART